MSLRKHAHEFNWKNFDSFNTFSQNIHCVHMLAPPQCGVSNEYPQCMFWIKIKKFRYTPVLLHVYKTRGIREYTFHGYVFLMIQQMSHHCTAWSPTHIVEQLQDCDYGIYGLNLKTHVSAIESLSGWASLAFSGPLSAIFIITYEPPRGETNNVVSEQVRHKPGCTSTEDQARDWKFWI